MPGPGAPKQMRGLGGWTALNGRAIEVQFAACSCAAQGALLHTAGTTPGPLRACAAHGVSTGPVPLSCTTASSTTPAFAS